MVRHHLLATAGHVDHGKSALVRALTGANTDRLPEEKSRGITIDLGFSSFDLASDGETYRVGVIDVPGHEDFVHHMVAGVGSVDVALLVVAADDGWMPQTEEHLEILAYLGVRSGVVAVSKIDLATDRIAVFNAIRQRLQGSALAEATLVATSVVTGEGMPALKAALLDQLRRVGEPVDLKKPRLQVDRVFSLPGVGTVVTGSAVGGRFERGQNVLIQPTGRSARIRSIQSHNRDVPTALPGTRSAFNLPDLRTGAKATIHRGDTVTVAGLGSASACIDVSLTRSNRALNEKPLRSGSRVYVHLGTAVAPARILLSNQRSIGGGETSLAQLRFDTPVYTLAGERLLIRDAAQRETLAGATVLDPKSTTPRWRSPGRVELLLRRSSRPNDPGEWAMSEIQFRGVVDAERLLDQSRFSAGAVSLAVHTLVNEGAVIRSGNVLVDATVWRSAIDAAETLIRAHVASHPEQFGLATTAVLDGVDPRLPGAAVLNELADRGFVRRAATIAPSTHLPRLPDRLRAAGDQLMAALKANPMQPPNRRELTPTDSDAQTIRYLIDTGQIVPLGSAVLLSRDALNIATEVVRRFLVAHTSASASELKTALGTTRRVMIPLLEWFDQNGVTRRVGDRRELA